MADWFKKLSPQEQQKYLKAHPNSQYAGLVKKRPAARQAMKTMKVPRWTKKDTKAVKQLSERQIARRRAVAEEKMATAFRAGAKKTLKSLYAEHDALSREALARAAKYKARKKK